MGKTEEDIKKELEEAQASATKDAKNRNLLYAQAELDLLIKEKKAEAVKLLINIVQKYNISNEDVIVLLENVPYI